MTKRKQDWSPRKVPAMHIELRFDMQGRIGNPPFDLRKTKDALIRLANAPEFLHLLQAALLDKGQDAEVVDGEVSANYFTFE